MRIRRLVDDSAAVSQVLSVVLLVTITVVLASVVGSAALGIGDQAEAAPTANFDVSYDEGAGTITIRHTGGQAIAASQLHVRGQSIDNRDVGNWVDAIGGEATGVLDGRSAVVSGDAATVSVTGDDYVVRVIWRSPKTDMTAELTVKRGAAS